jgi:UDP-N-acetyl-2-amino-2-deoxyglucuronate dehydrogenase
METDMTARIFNFGLVGAAGFVAPRHLKAIKDTGNRLIAAVDPHDSVGVLDRFFPEARFFSEIERFDRHLEKLRRKADGERLDYLSVCSPNYLHDAHVRLALRLGAHAICEKPLVINPWNLDQLAELEAESPGRVYTTLQLRHHEGLKALKAKLDAAPPAQKVDVVLTYTTLRGPWYHVSWKGSAEKSGGLAMNLGVHFFDLVQWLFGEVEAAELHLSQPGRMAGVLELAHARVRWFLSVDGDDIPAAARAAGKTAYRAMSLDGEEVEFSSGFTDLHTRVYEDILAGGGLGIDDARPSVALVQRIRHAEVTPPGERAHPLLRA